MTLSFYVFRINICICLYIYIYIYICTYTQGKEGIATHYILAWRIPWTEEPGGWGGSYSPWGLMELYMTEST